MTYDYAKYMTYLHAKAGTQGVPLAGTFELTPRCTLNCRMCYIHRPSQDAAALAKEKDTQWWIRLAEQAQKSGMLMLLLTGGEPMLRQDFREIYAACQKLGILLTVNTNATLIDDRMLDFLRTHLPLRLNITLYGASAETYRRLCGNGGAYERVINAILSLKQAGIALKLNYSVTKENLADLPAAYAFAQANELTLQVATYMFPPVRTEGCAEDAAQRLSAEEAAQAQFLWRRLSCGDEGFLQRIRAFRAGHPTPAPPDDCQLLPAQKLRCRAGLSTFWVTWDGELRPCGMMQTPTTAIGEDFPAAWQAVKAAREEILVPGKCMHCPLQPLCDVCAALTQAESGRFDEVPRYACEKAQAYWKLCDEFSKNTEKND